MTESPPLLNDVSQYLPFVTFVVPYITQKNGEDRRVDNARFCVR